MNDLSPCCKGNSRLTKLFGGLSYEKIWRYNNSPPYVTVRWPPQQILLKFPWYVLMYGGCLSTKKVNLSVNTMTDFCKTWYAGSGGHKYYPHGLSSPNLIPYHLHFFSDWLITKKANIQSSIRDMVTKLGVWVVVGRSTIHKVCRHQMCIFNTLFAYLFWLANNKKKSKYPELCMGYRDETKLGMWVVVGRRWSFITECIYLIPHLHICSDWLITTKANIQSSVWTTVMKLGMWVAVGRSTTHVVCCHRMCIFNTSFACLFWLANNKKANSQSSVWPTVMKRGMWVVFGIRITHVCLSSPNEHI